MRIPNPSLFYSLTLIFEAKINSKETFRRLVMLQDLRFVCEWSAYYATKKTFKKKNVTTVHNNFLNSA